jgi:hypothetical protein
MRDLPELFESGLEVLDDFMGKHFRVEKIVRSFKTLVSKAEDIEAGLVSVNWLFMIVRAPPGA